MFKKSIITLAAATIMATAVPSISNARDGGGSDRPYATAYHPDKTITSRGQKNGDRKVTTKFKNGKPKKVRKMRRKSRPWASSTNTRTGRTTLSVGNGAGMPRTIFHFSAFGGLVGIGFSN